MHNVVHHSSCTDLAAIASPDAESDVSAAYKSSDVSVYIHTTFQAGRELCSHDTNICGGPLAMFDQQSVFRILDISIYLFPF